MTFMGCYKIKFRIVERYINKVSHAIRISLISLLQSIIKKYVMRKSLKVMMYNFLLTLTLIFLRI